MVRDLVFLRAVLIASLLLSAGCFGMCGPTLHRLLFSAAFPATFDDANKTIAQEAVEEMGYQVTGSGPGGFYTAELPDVSDASLWVQRAQNGTIVFNMYVSAGDKEYDSADEARQAGFRLAPQHWATFNSTLAAFEDQTSWDRFGASTVEPEVYVC